MSVEITNMYLFVVAQYQEHNYAMFLGDLIRNMCHLVVAQYQEYNYATFPGDLIIILSIHTYNVRTCCIAIRKQCHIMK